MIPLPIDAHIDAILDAARRSRAVVVTAAPGAGKTTRVPAAFVADGPVILLQPRRVAARAIAARIAAERGWTLGREVGWQIRFDRRYSSETRLLVVTEGVLTARLQSDPLLSTFRTIVVDEFHERSVHADLALALARQAWKARDDLRIVVMSATLDTAPVSAFLDGCPIVDVPGRLHPIDITYQPGRSVADAVVEVCGMTDGNILCFLPGASEIRYTIDDINRGRASFLEVEVVPLHGSLDPEEQDGALKPSVDRRIIVATNIAETSLTVPGVTAVVDTGLHKVARYDAERGLDSLETERITADAADQRAGRAGRVGPGLVRRLWDARDRLRPHREPEIRRIDLSSPALDVIAWGGDPHTFEWFERPQERALDAALALLARLELIRAERAENAEGSDRAGGVARNWKLTEIGERVHQLPLHPRLARMMVVAGGSRDMARACALLSERHILPPRASSTSSDLLSALDQWESVPLRLQRVAIEIQRLAKVVPADGRVVSESDFRHAILASYSDRVAQRREAGSPNVLLCTGTGATLARESGVHDGEFIVAHDISHSSTGLRAVLGDSKRQTSASGQSAGAGQPRIRIATRIEREWLQPTSTAVVHRLDHDSGSVSARRVERYDALVLAEHPVAVDPAIAERLLVEAWLERGPTQADDLLLRRLRFTGQTIDLAHLVAAAARGARRLDDVVLLRGLSAEMHRAVERHAPETLLLPSGRRTRLVYAEDGTVDAAVKLQEVFGLADTPRVGPRREPVRIALLAPNGRPVQITRDLRSFWDRTYPDVRKELRGRYPKHPWPEDPWKASPSARTKRKSHV